MKARLTNVVIHVIKIHAQKVISNSWQGTLTNELQWVHKHKDKEVDYSTQIEEVYERALGKASAEIFNSLEIEALEQILNKQLVILHCKSLVHLGSDTRGWPD